MQIIEIIKESMDFDNINSVDNLTLVPISLKKGVKHKSLIRALKEEDITILESENVNSLKIKDSY